MGFQNNVIYFNNYQPIPLQITNRHEFFIMRAVGGLLMLLGVKGIILGVPVLASAMPATALVAVFAEKHGADALLASSAVFLSTILSIVTIPGMIFLLQLAD